MWDLMVRKKEVQGVVANAEDGYFLHKLDIQTK